MLRACSIGIAVASMGLLTWACQPGEPASYPDDADVASAQKKWCAALAAVEGSSFQHAKECEAARPRGSAAFVARMAECYQQRMKELGDAAPDMGAIVGECTQQILVGAEPGNVAGSPVVKARCARSERCDGVDPTECATAFNKLEGNQKAVFTSLYNIRTQTMIASCIDDLDCGGGPEVENACFDEPYDQRVWMPFSLGPDPSVAPR